MPAQPRTWGSDITAAAFEHAGGSTHTGAGITPSCAVHMRAAPAASEHSSSCRGGASRYLQHCQASGEGSCWPCIGFSTRGVAGRKRSRFAALSLGDWRLRLPILKERSPPYDPWDAASQEAPRGVRRRFAEGTLGQQSAASTAAQQHGSSAAETCAAEQPPPLQQQLQQQQTAPRAQPSAAADAQGSGAAGKQIGRQDSSGAHGAGGRQRGRGLPAWLVSCGSTPHRSATAGLLAVTTTQPGIPKRRMLVMLMCTCFRLPGGAPAAAARRPGAAQQPAAVAGAVAAGGVARQAPPHDRAGLLFVR